MHRVLFPLSGALLVIIAVWAALLFLRQPEKISPSAEQSPLVEEQTQTAADESTPSEQPVEETSTAEATTEAIPELNPAQKTNPFSGTYKNPFAK